MPIRKEAATTVMLISEPTDMSKPPTSSAFNWGHGDKSERRGRQQQVPPV